MSYLEICGLDCTRKISIKSVTLCCSCCLIENVALIDSTKCDHYKSYKKIFSKTVTKDGTYVCTQCHAVIMKIMKFKLMVDHSEYVLKNKLNKFSKQNIFQLQITKQENIDLDVSENDIEFKEELTDIEFKSEPEECTDYDVPQEVEAIEEKYEIDISDNTPDVISDVIQEIKVDPLPEKWEGKIRYIHLTVEQMTQERIELANQASFVDLEYKCNDCIIGFAYAFKYAAHMESKHVKKKDTTLCDLCKCYVKNHNMKRHLLTHYARWQCCNCNIMFKTKYAIIAHYNETHGKLEGYEFKCNLCSFVARSYRTVTYHKKKHGQYQESSTYKCEICKKCFTANSSLKSHVEIFHSSSKDAETFECKTCKKTFKLRNKLRYHIKHVHEKNASDWSHFCDICNIVLKTKYVLTEHMKAHNRRLECDYCGQQYKRKPELTDHILKHMNSSKLVCKICGKFLSTRKTLSIHMKTVHEKVQLPRNHICDYCGKAFTSASILKQHVNTHTGARPYVCKFCDSSFGHKAALYTHTRLVHLGGKRKSELPDTK